MLIGIVFMQYSWDVGKRIKTGNTIAQHAVEKHRLSLNVIASVGDTNRIFYLNIAQIVEQNYLINERGTRHMKQYCRYCYLCCDGDAYYCTEKAKILSESQLLRPNNCPHYGYCGIDIITGKVHVERHTNTKVDNGSEQIKLDEVSK